MRKSRRPFCCCRMSLLQMVTIQVGARHALLSHHSIILGLHHRLICCVACQRCMTASSRTRWFHWRTVPALFSSLDEHTCFEWPDIAPGELRISMSPCTSSVQGHRIILRWQHLLILKQDDSGAPLLENGTQPGNTVSRPHDLALL